MRPPAPVPPPPPPAAPDASSTPCHAQAQALARSCGFDPVSTAAGSAEPSLAVSWYAREGGEPFWPRWQATPHLHMLGVQLKPQWMRSRTNGRLTWHGVVPAMGVGLSRAGDAGEAEVRGALSRLMYFLPVALLDRCAEQAGLAVGAAAPELVNPGYAQDPEIAKLGQQTVFALRHDGPLSRLRLDALGQLLAVRLLERWSSVSGRGSRLFARSPAPQAIERALEVLHARYAEPLGIAVLAQAAGLSDHHFCRAFRAATGQSPHQYQLALRIERAQALLQHSALAVGEIASMVGYDDASHLTRLFRARVGATPSAYRKATMGRKATTGRA